MAAGRFTILDLNLVEMGKGKFNFSTDDWKVVLTTKTQALTAAFIGTSGNAVYSDLTAEITGTGYTAGGTPLLNPVWSGAGAVATFSADPTQWDGLVATAKYAVLIRDDVAKPILGFFDLETTNADGRVSAGGDFVINWLTGVFTQTRVS